MNNLISQLGYSEGSPFAGNPYLDIETPEGLIDMSNTPIDLWGIDNKGNKKKMKAGRKNPYRFAGSIVREIPVAQKGGNPFGDPRQLALNNMARTDQTRVNGIPTNAIPVDIQAIKEMGNARVNVKAKELVRRKKAINKSNLDPGFKNAAAAEKLRFFPDDPDSFIDEYLNPLRMVGSMADNLGRTVMNPRSNIVDDIAAVSMPVAVGALAGVGAQTYPEFANNLANPFAGIASKKDLSNLYDNISRKIATPKSYALNPAEQKLLSSVRNAGHIFNSGNVYDNQELLSSLIKKADQLPDKNFENLTGWNKAELRTRLDDLKANGVNKKQVYSEDDLGDIESDIITDVPYDPELAREQYRLANGSDLDADIAGHSAEQRDYLASVRSALIRRDAENRFENLLADMRASRPVSEHIPTNSEVIADHINAGRRSINLTHPTRGRTIIPSAERSAELQFTPEEFSSLATGLGRESEINLRNPAGDLQHAINSVRVRGYTGRIADLIPSGVHPLSPEVIQSLNSYAPKKSLVAKLNDRLSSDLMKETNLPITEALIPSLAKRSTNNPAKEMLSAYRAVKNSEKGSSFIPAHSLSSDSFPASISLINRAVDDGIVDVGFHGYSPMNNMGFSQKAGLPLKTNLNEINSLIANLNSKLEKKIPMAKIQNDKIMYPTITVKKKGKGGYMAKGGLSASQIYSFLFDDDDEFDEEDEPTAPSVSELQTQQQEEVVTNLPRKKGNPYTGRQGDNKAQYAFNFFKDRGLEDFQAAGVVANLIQESGNFRDDVISGQTTGDNNVKDKGYGIAQWRGDRYKNLIQFAQNEGMNPYSLDAQLRFVEHEARQRGDWAKLQQAGNLAEATHSFNYNYEVSADSRNPKLKYFRTKHVLDGNGQLIFK